MASKKKNPSFEIPDAVRQAGQSGWVYRTDGAKAKRLHRNAPAHPAGTAVRPPAHDSPQGPKSEVRSPTSGIRSPQSDIRSPMSGAVDLGPRTPDLGPVSSSARVTVQPEHAQSGWTMSTGVIGLGLHVAAVPLVVPLYVTAAISRKLGLLPR